ncbi:hypothetical protein CYMTET_40019 [Cymbomonas tetramitiformis]|uniref:Tudor domain-containing protein n=1 Tax=Cymbomonas tetramitiformis TaxID=36881 RepID=A0AAE0F515_9CHLO|nr:hypothetical protein CYMTET_40019 [Cymbomonas tetramitiformis]
MEGAAGQAADLAVTDSVNNERRVDGGRSAGQSVGPAMAALPVGTLVEVYWPGERSWYGGRLGGGASVEGATVIEYLDGNPEREEVFLEDRPRGPGDHDGFLSRRGGGRRVGVKTVGGWSREAEKGLLMGWRRLPRGDAGAGAGGETEGVSGEDGAGVDGLAGGMASAARLTRCPEQSCGHIPSETGLRQHQERTSRPTSCSFYSRAWFFSRSSRGVAQVIKERCARFLRGEWEGLHAEVPGDQRAVAEADEELRDAVRLVKAGQLGKATKRLELAKLAPVTEETLLKLERLHPAWTGRRQDVGEDRRRELQGQALELDEKTFDDVMRNLPRATGPGSSHWRWEHMWAVHVSGGRDALLEVCNHLAAGRAPAGVREWLAGARLVSLLKDDLGVNVRPIACGEVLRKLVAKVICRQRAKAWNLQVPADQFGVKHDYLDLLQ